MTHVFARGDRDFDQWLRADAMRAPWRTEFRQRDARQGIDLSARGCVFGATAG
jgi:hypothetical protein